MGGWCGNSQEQTWRHLPVFVSVCLCWGCLFQIDLHFTIYGMEMKLISTSSPGHQAEGHWRKDPFETSLVVQWLGVCLPMQGTWVRSLVREVPICHGATCIKTTEACVPRAHTLQQEMPPQWEVCTAQLEHGSRSLQLEKARMQQRRPSTAMNKYIKF